MIYVVKIRLSKVFANVILERCTVTPLCGVPSLVLKQGGNGTNICLAYSYLQRLRTDLSVYTDSINEGVIIYTHLYCVQVSCRNIIGSKKNLMKYTHCFIIVFDLPANLNLSPWIYSIKNISTCPGFAGNSWLFPARSLYLKNLTEAI